MTIPERAVQWAVDIANDDSHGYTQDLNDRWGPNDYDCSSFVISAYRAAGLPLSCSYTGNMEQDFRKNGFWDVKSKVNLNTGSGMQPGDVLLYHEAKTGNGHTALYIGDGNRVVEATGNENGGALGGIPGDQTGREIVVQPYHNFGSGWGCVLRYQGRDPDEGLPPEEGGDEDIDVPNKDEDTYTVKRGDTLWEIAMRHDMSVYDLANMNGISLNDYIYPGQVLRVKPVEEKPADPDTYIVKAGDSLWQIAQEQMGSGWKWPEIAYENGIPYPYRIYPGDKLKIPKGD